MSSIWRGTCRRVERPGTPKLPARADRLSMEVLQQRWAASRDSSRELLLNSILACVMRCSRAFVALAAADMKDSSFSLRSTHHSRSKAQ